jgi:hypothetical protein
MNCPKCGTPAAAGVTYCKRCGTALAAKAKAAAAKSEESSSDEIDLMPMEESKTPAYSAYEPPPGLDVGPPPPAGKKAAPEGPPDPNGPPPDLPGRKIRGANAAPDKLPIGKIIGGGLGLILLCVVGWMVFRTKNEIKLGQAKYDKVQTVNPNQTFIHDLEATGVVPYTLEFEVAEGEALVGITKRNPKDPKTVAAVKKLDEPLKTLKKGEKESFTGELKNKEQWSWIIANDSKKPTRVKVKFLAKP